MPISRRLAVFNRVFANHIAGPVFLRLPGYGSICHKGRKSGREYRTPVKLFRLGSDYIITLPYGRECDWVKNVLAADGCELVTRGTRIALGHPRLCYDDGQAQVPRMVRAILRRMNATEYLALSPEAGSGLRKEKPNFA